MPSCNSRQACGVTPVSRCPTLIEGCRHGGSPLRSQPSMSQASGAPTIFTFQLNQPSCSPVTSVLRGWAVSMRGAGGGGLSCQRFIATWPRSRSTLRTPGCFASQRKIPDSLPNLTANAFWTARASNHSSGPIRISGLPVSSPANAARRFSKLLAPRAPLVWMTKIVGLASSRSVFCASAMAGPFLRAFSQALSLGLAARGWHSWRQNAAEWQRPAAIP